MWWGNDITKCTGIDCPYKENCYRYTVPPDRLQSYSDFAALLKDEEKCEHFIDNRKE